MYDSFDERMNATEMRSTAGLALIFTFRMLGMFMILPVLATYGQDLAGATPVLIGLAIGAYGLTQALLQIPFGMMSDRVGRRPVIIAGLLIFAFGSVVAAQADSIGGVILGRILQGTGAISAVVMAMLSDLVREQHRTKAMAVIGMCIGLSFAVAMVIGPLITQWFALPGLFWFSVIMALIGIVIVLFMVPTPRRLVRSRESTVVSTTLMATLKNGELFRLDLGILVLHSILMASFVALPLALVHEGGLAKEQHWWVYLTAMLIGFFGMLPFVIYGEKRRRLKRVLVGAIFALMLCEAFFWLFGDRLWTLVLGITLFFAAFNLLEACLPSLVSKVSPAGHKGTAMGVYSTSQFAGAALGGIVGGLLIHYGGAAWVYLGCMAMLLIWLFFAATMREPPYVTSLRMVLSEDRLKDATLIDRLQAMKGIEDVEFVAEESALYLKVDQREVDRQTLFAMI